MIFRLLHENQLLLLPGLLRIFWQLAGGMHNVDHFPKIVIELTQKGDVGKCRNDQFSHSGKHVTQGHRFRKQVRRFDLIPYLRQGSIGEAPATLLFVVRDDFFQTLQGKVRPLNGHGACGYFAAEDCFRRRAAIRADNNAFASPLG